MNTRHLLANLLITLLTIISSEFTSAQTFSSLRAPSARLASCDEFFESIDKPVDMDAKSDVNRGIPDADLYQLTSISMTNGVFSAVATSNDPRVYLLSPRDCGAFPAGPQRWGSITPIDTTKYTRLSFRMFTDVASNFQVSWNQDCWYHQKYLVTNDIPTKVGWHTYVVDLPAQSVTAVEGGTGTWSSRPATSFRIDPTSTAGATVQIDWVRLEDPTTCGSSALTHTASAPAGYSMTLFADDGTDPLNGFTGRLAKDVATTSTSTTLSAASIHPGSGNLVGWLTDDYASTYGDPWDFRNSNAVTLTSDITNLAFTGGAVTGRTTGGAPSLYLRTYDDGIDTSRFRYLSIKATQTVASNLAIFWGNGSGFQGQLITRAEHDSNGDNVYQVDLGVLPGWTGTARFKEFVLRPVSAAGAQFSVEFVQLSASGFKTAEPVPVAAVSPDPLRVNNAPYMKLIEPSEDGGVAFRVWNFRSTDEVLEPSHLSQAEVLPYNLVDGRIGSFFHGKNSTDDPVFYLLHPFRPFPSILVDADRFYKLSWSAYVKDVPNRLDILNGSVIRVIYRDPTQQTLFDGDDIIHVIQGWETTNWTDFAIDMKDYWIETGPATNRPGTWTGMIDGLRIDPHEFKEFYEFYHGRTALRAPDEANSRFALVFDGVESDAGENVTVRFFANTSKSTSGGTQIASTTLGAQSRVVIADVSGLAEGKYFIYGRIDDGTDSTARLAGGELRIIRSIAADTTAPTLNVRNPSAGLEFDSYLPIEGYAFDESFAAVEVLIDGVRLSTFKPNLFDHAAATTESNQEAPGSGFERSLDTTTIAAGAHTVQIKAFDTAGNVTTREFQVVKRTGAAPGFTTKPSPDTPAVTVPGGSAPAPTPTPVPPSGATFSLRGSHTAQGKLTLTASQVPSSACSMTLFASATRDGAPTSVRTVSVPAKTGAATRSVVMTANVGVDKKKLKAAFFSVQATCGETVGSSAVAQVKFKSTKGVKDVSALVRKLSRGVKAKGRR